MGIENSIEAGKRNFAIANEKKRLEALPKKLLLEKEREERQRKILIRRFLKALKKYERYREKMSLSNQHGTVIGDYYRCKRTNGIACQPCKDVAAKYVSHKWKTDPKYKAREKEWLKQNPHKRYNKRRKPGSKERRYTRKQIFDRDGINCYLCGKPTDPTATHIQGQEGWETYPHVEHVIPLSKGGTDTLENVRIAHAKCNIDKGIKLLEEL
mgnify:CR=1 FL=1